MDELGLIDSSRDFPSIRVINFIINLCLILLIGVVNVVQNFLLTKRALHFSDINVPIRSKKKQRKLRVSASCSFLL